MNARFRRIARPIVLSGVAYLLSCAEISHSSLPKLPMLTSDIELVAESADIVAGRVPRNATLGALLRAHALSEELVNSVVESTRGAFDLRRLRANQPYRLSKTIDGVLRFFEYEIDADRFLRIVPKRDVSGQTTEIAAEVVPFEKELATISLRGVIDREHSSLFAAIDAAGESADLAMTFANIFAGEIDFNTELQPGDSFEIVFEKKFREGRFAGYGPVSAAEFVNTGRRLRAVRYTPPDGEPGYYDDQGRSLKRFFLKSPLPFEPRITSGFSASRMHPVLHYARAHLGVDYGAPEGAPVLSVASGVIVSAAYDASAGRNVRIRHASGFETQYLHLSAFARDIAAGAHVSQGQLIGRVGSTGLATGAHLHYMVRKNGQPVNPVVVHRSMPPGEPVADAHRAAFEAERDAWLSRLFSAPPPSIAN